MMRYFKRLPSYHGNPNIPQRQTPGSAGYDLEASETAVLQPNKPTLVPTGLTADIPEDEFLAIYIRSSLALKRGIFLANSVGIIDSDYFGNHIQVMLINMTNQPQTIEAGERIAQGIFQKYLITWNDHPIKEQRSGGFGSTDKKD
jgi:dUTP pyrophosphatase